MPGDLFSRDAVIRSIREIQQLGFFDPEKINPQVTPDDANGSVDITYQLIEKSSSEFNVSGGWGEAIGFMFSGGVSLTNFSARKFFKKDAWKPFPQGDGQRLGFQISTNGTYYSALNVSFTEPWLGGKKPNALTVGAFYSYQVDPAYGYYHTSDTIVYKLAVYGMSISLGKRLKVPDDYFTFVHGFSILQYNTKNYTGFVIPTGVSNNLNYNFTFARNSVDQPLYPRTGSEFSLGGQLTFPYSLVNGKDYDALRAAGDYQSMYLWLEYYKLNFKASWFFNIVGDLVLNTRARFGFLGYYNKKVGYSPFERYFLGGNGMDYMGSLYGKDVVAMRGYDPYLHQEGGGTVFDKFTIELRYPITLNPTASIYVLGFFEAGNTWSNFESFSPFKVYRSAGVGLRLYMPMFGLLGLDWGYGFDNVPLHPNAGGSKLQISIGQMIE
jgi:outer membrane protein insertion porin family